MKLDTTLLNMDGIPTDADMQAFFRAHECTPQQRRWSKEKAYRRVRKIVRKTFQRKRLKWTKAG